jgi:hypothetical protein
MIVSGVDLTSDCIEHKRYDCDIGPSVHDIFTVW